MAPSGSGRPDGPARLRLRSRGRISPRTPRPARPPTRPPTRRTTSRHPMRMWPRPSGRPRARRAPGVAEAGTRSARAGPSRERRPGSPSRSRDRSPRPSPRSPDRRPPAHSAPSTARTDRTEGRHPARSTGNSQMTARMAACRARTRRRVHRRAPPSPTPAGPVSPRPLACRRSPLRRRLIPLGSGCRAASTRSSRPGG